MVRHSPYVSKHIYNNYFIVVTIVLHALGLEVGHIAVYITTIVPHQWDIYDIFVQYFVTKHLISMHSFGSLSYLVCLCDNSLLITRLCQRRGINLGDSGWMAHVFKRFTNPNTTRQNSYFIGYILDILVQISLIWPQFGDTYFSFTSI